MLSRDHASLSGIDEKRENIHAAAARGRDIDVSHASLARTEAMLQQAMQAHGLAERTLFEMKILQARLRNGQACIRRMERFLVALMEGGLTAIAGEEAFAQFLIDATGWNSYHGLDSIYRLYIETTYGDPTQPRTLDTSDNDMLRLAIKYFPKQTEEAYLAQKLAYFKKATKTIYLDYNQTREEAFTPDEIRQKLDKAREELLGGGRMTKTDEILQKKYGWPEYEFEWVFLPDVPFGVLHGSELAFVRNSCETEIREQAQSDVFTKIDKCIEICHLLIQPENHILVPSGQYVEKAVQIASTQEMINQATQTLSGAWSPLRPAAGERQRGRTAGNGRLPASRAPRRAGDSLHQTSGQNADPAFQSGADRASTPALIRRPFYPSWHDRGGTPPRRALDSPQPSSQG
jgi:hypothetical protein